MVRECERTLIATVRSSRVSRARYTSPMPPAPIAATISYGPSRAPLVKDTAVSCEPHHNGRRLAGTTLNPAGVGLWLQGFCQYAPLAVAGLEKLIVHMKSKPGVWFATHE